MDRLTSKQTPEGTLTYTYDAAGHVASIASSNPGGASMNYTYDSLNRLSTVLDAHLGTTTYAYDNANNVFTATYPNGIQTVYAYDQLNRLTGLNSSQLGPYTYQLDPAGKRTSALEPNNRSISWNYDGINRLQSEQVTGDPNGKNGLVSYGLDPVGNRTSVSSAIPGLSPVSGTFNQDDELSSETYDANGDVTSTGGKNFAYDSQNHLVSMNNGAVQIVYDSEGNRVRKIANGVTTTYLVDDLNPTGYPQVIEELTSGAVTRTYTYGLQRVGEYQPVNSTWTPSFYGYDGGGNVRALMNSAGAVTDTYEYDAFGVEVATSGNTPNEMLYRGEQHDSDLGLYYLRARYMNPLTGRFLSSDANDGDYSNPATLHKYLYASGDPVNRLDPNGRTDAIEYPRLLTIAAVATTGVIAYEVAINCGYGSSGSRTSATVYAGPFGQVTHAGPCWWEGTPPTIYPLPFPFPISTPAPTGGPGTCGPKMQWHHTLPREFRDFFEEKCNFPNIDAPDLGMCLPDDCHRRVHGSSNGTDWNSRWEDQIDNVWGGQCPGQQAVISFAQELALEFADDLMCQ